MPETLWHWLPSNNTTSTCHHPTSLFRLFQTCYTYRRWSFYFSSLFYFYFYFLFCVILCGPSRTWSPRPAKLERYSPPPCRRPSAVFSPRRRAATPPPTSTTSPRCFFVNGPGTALDASIQGSTVHTHTHLYGWAWAPSSVQHPHL